VSAGTTTRTSVRSRRRRSTAAPEYWHPTRAATDAAGEQRAILLAADDYSVVSRRGRPGTADDVAALVTFLVSPAAGYLTGTSQVIDGGLLPTV
jgi:NAD(P)-dependent dehydrogenase (short-subunit alcohol dehydrogenase family)